MWVSSENTALEWAFIFADSLPFGHHENHLIWVDSSLMVPWASMRLLVSNNKDQPPPPDHLQNVLIWVDLIKVIPLTLCKMSLERQYSIRHRKRAFSKICVGTLLFFGLILERLDFKILRLDHKEKVTWVFLKSVFLFELVCSSD